MDHTNVDSGDESLPLIIDEIEEAEQRPGASMNAGEQVKYISVNRILYSLAVVLETCYLDQMIILSHIVKNLHQWWNKWLQICKCGNRIYQKYQQIDDYITTCIN